MSAEHEQWAAPPAHATGTVQFVPVEDIAPDETFRLRPDGDVSQLATALGRLGQLAPVELRRWQGASSAGPQWQVVSGFRRLAAVRMLARERVLARLHGELGEGDAWGLALGEALLHEPLTGPELEALRERLRATRLAPWAEELVDEALVRAPVPGELRERFSEFLTAAASSAPSAAASPGQPSSPRVRAPDDDHGEAPTASAVAAREAARPDEPGAGQPEPAEGPVAETPVVPSVDPAISVALAAEAAADGEPAVDYVEVTPDELVQDLIGRLAALNQDLATAVDAWDDLPPDGRKAVVEQARYVAALLPFMEAKD